MKVWLGKGNQRYLTLLKADLEVKAILPEKELEALFDVSYYLRYVDDIFKRIGLTENQWQKISREVPNLTLRSL